MKLRKIEFEGIRAFADKTTFHFGRSPGLYFLQGGENGVDPELGSNGVGKSTIWAILCWILFGKTAEGLRAADLKSWQSSKKGYYGKLWAGRSIVHRSWRPNKLTLDGKVVEQRELEDYLGINYDTFVTSVILAQGESMFFDLSPPKKLSIFTSLLKLDNWIDYSKKAKYLSEEIEDSINKQENIISRLSGKIDGLDIGTLQEKSDSFKSFRYKELTRSQHDFEAMNHDYSEIKKRVKKSDKYGKRLEDKISKEEGELEECKALLSIVQDTKAKNQKKLIMLLSKISALEDRLDYLEKHKGKKCLSCSQHISGKLAKEQYLRIDVDINKLEEERRPLSRSSKQSAKMVKGGEQEIKAHEENLKKHWREKKKFDKNNLQLNKDFEKVKAARQIIANFLDKAKKSTNPYKALLLDKKKEETRLLAKLKKKKQYKDRLQARQDNTYFWVQGFKDVRLYLIEEALLQLELETSKALQDLGFSEQWSISYSVDKKAKSGSLISGFNILVKSPYSKEQVPFAAWSGGEKQRLKIAGSIGFISLVTDRISLDLGLEVYDEPTQHLSPEGIDNLLETLRLRALKTDKRIWLVDHHTLDYGDFSGHSIASKGSDGRSLVWQN